ncbi:hypothetical protein EW093_00175 [Thiospirochaeta perfilievii]|uniref:FeoB-associated Cys-rich membrane protein n=1 Tax=Thiospirochaeta perfilievii TaxID=252967 RepID=A0A5C1QAJ8_9SPIO|nr:hypothetical protein [Thiospirochaeta perfilievii]QEN03182.1 hypothetical protein EW093_00175 [Thiospirochaeta perfilievii]
MRVFIGILVVLFLISFYFIGWKLNRREKLPEEMKDSFKKCDGCSSTGCGINPSQRGDNDE